MKAKELHAHLPNRRKFAKQIATLTKEIDKLVGQRDAINEAQHALAGEEIVDHEGFAILVHTPPESITTLVLPVADDVPRNATVEPVDFEKPDGPVRVSCHVLDKPSKTVEVKTHKAALRLAKDWVANIKPKPKESKAPKPEGTAVAATPEGIVVPQPAAPPAPTALGFEPPPEPTVEVAE